MFAKKGLASVLFAAGMIGAVAAPLPAMAAVDLYVNIGPPAVQYEAVPRHRAGYVWAPGYWDYRDNNHVWVGGSQIKARKGYNYQPHRWVEHDGRWNQEPGRWDRR